MEEALFDLFIFLMGSIVGLIIMRIADSQKVDYLKRKLQDSQDLRTLLIDRYHAELDMYHGIVYDYEKRLDDCRSKLKEKPDV